MEKKACPAVRVKAKYRLKGAAFCDSYSTSSKKDDTGL